MDKELERILNQLSRFNTINKEDAPILVKLVKELYDNRELAWAMVDKLENEMGAFR